MPFEPSLPLSPKPKCLLVEDYGLVNVIPSPTRSSISSELSPPLLMLSESPTNSQIQNIISRLQKIFLESDSLCKQITDNHEIIKQRDRLAVSNLILEIKELKSKTLESNKYIQNLNTLSKTQLDNKLNDIELFINQKILVIKNYNSFKKQGNRCW